MRRARLFLLAPLILMAFVGFMALGGFVVQWLWNWLLPPLFGLPAVTFWQALGLLALSRILFGGVGRGPGRHGCRRRSGRWMTREERVRLREKMRARFGAGAA